MKTLIIRDSNQQVSVTNIKDDICDDAKAMRTQKLIILAGYLSHSKNPIGDEISNNLSMAQNIPHFFKDELEAFEDIGADQKHADFKSKQDAEYQEFLKNRTLEIGNFDALESQSLKDFTAEHAQKSKSRLDNNFVSEDFKAQLEIEKQDFINNQTAKKNEFIAQMEKSTAFFKETQEANQQKFRKTQADKIDILLKKKQNFKAQTYEKYVAQAEALIPNDLEYFIVDNIETPQKEFDRDAWRFDGEKIVTDPQKQIEIIRTRRNALLDDLDIDEAKAQFRGADILQAVQAKKQILRDFPQVVESSGLTDPNAIREFTIEAYKQLFS